jgi:hypothetical protein
MRSRTVGAPFKPSFSLADEITVSTVPMHSSPVKRKAGTADLTVAHVYKRRKGEPAPGVLRIGCATRRDQGASEYAPGPVIRKAVASNN